MELLAWRDAKANALAGQAKEWNWAWRGSGRVMNYSKLRLQISTGWTKI